MNTDELIRNLAADLRPISRLPSPLKRFARWTVAGLFCLGLGVASYGLRSDLERALQRPEYLAEGLVLLLLATSSALAAFTYSVPGWGRAGLALRVATAVLASWALLELYRAELLGSPYAVDWGHGPACVRKIV